MVTVYCPLTTTGAGELLVHTADEPRFVVDCKVKPVALVGHVKITFPAEGTKASCGDNERLKTTPKPKSPPNSVVP